MAPFYGWGSTASGLEPLRGGSVLFTTNFAEIPGTHFINLGRMKGWVVLNMGPVDWESDALTTRPLLHECLNTLLNVSGNESGELAVVWGHGGAGQKP